MRLLKGESMEKPAVLFRNIRAQSRGGTQGNKLGASLTRKEERNRHHPQSHTRYRTSEVRRCGGSRTATSLSAREVGRRTVQYGLANPGSGIAWPRRIKGERCSHSPFMRQFSN